jgi:hypothetical protein
MTYAINPQVIINDVEYKGITVNGINLTNGRITVNEQPRAGYASIILITPDNTYPNIEIDQKVVVKVDDSTGADIILWTGWVSDIQTSIAKFGSEGLLNQQSITAIGSLSKLNRRLAGGAGYPKEFDGDRVYDILFESAGITWGTYSPPTDTWSDVDPLLQWQNVDLLIGNIDRPGDFELRAYSSGESSGLNLAQQAAASGLGVLFECNEGKICYSSYTSRTDDASLNGFTDIDKEAILTNGLSSVSRLSDLANDVEVTYKNNQSERDQDNTSIALYGLYAAKINTLLENDYDAVQRVNYYLETRAFPRRRLSQINLALHLDQVSNTMRDSMLPMRVSKPIRIAGLPPSIYPDNFIGFVEGFTWTINRNELFLTLNVSEYALSQLEMNWSQVPSNLEWQDVSATLEWQEARVVA